MKRILAPKVRKRDDSIDQFFSVMSVEDSRREEESDDLTLNPVVQAKLHIEAHNRHHLEGHRPRGGFKAGALGKLKLELGAGKTSHQNLNKEAMKRLDMELRKDNEEHKHQWSARQSDYDY